MNDKVKVKENSETLASMQRLYKITTEIDALKPLNRFYDYYGIEGRNASDMLIGAIEVLGNENNSERFSQAAHSLREILYPLFALYDDKFRSKRKDKGASRQDILDILPQVFPEFDISKIQDIYSQLCSIAHHSHGSKNYSVQKLIMLIEEFVDLMLIITKPDKYRIGQLEDDSLVEDIMKKPPPQNHAGKKKLECLINKNLATRSYIFLKADERWLGWLYENGFLDVIIKDANEFDNTRYNISEMNYLIRMSQITPKNTTDILVRIIAEIPKDTIRYWVFMGILEICTKILPAQLSILLEAIYSTRWIPLFSDNRNSSFRSNRHSLSSFHFKSIFKILADAKYNEELLRLANKLLSVKNKNDTQKQNRYLQLGDDTFYYNDLAATGVFQSLLEIPNDYVENGFDLTTKVMQNIIKLSDKPSAEIAFPICNNSNFSSFDFFKLKIDSVGSWSNEDNQIRVGALIVYFARKLFDESSVSKEYARAYYEKHIGDFDNLNARLPDNQTMWRLRFFILSLAPNFFQDKLEKSFWRLFTVKHYYDISDGTEYTKALKKCFGYLSKDYQTSYVNKFLSYFSSVIGEAKYQEDITKEKKSDYITKEYHRYMVSPIISMIASHLTDEQKQEVKKIGLEIIPNCEPEPIAKIRPTITKFICGPISEELFAKLSISDIVAELCNEWSPEKLGAKYRIFDDDCFINEGGVSDLLRENMPERLQEYINEANSFFAPPKLDLFYTSAYLEGLGVTVIKFQDLAWKCNWVPVINLCSAIKDYYIRELRKEEAMKTSNYANNELLDRQGLILKMLYFLQSILSVRHDGSVIDLSKYNIKIFNLLKYFLMDSDPISEVITYPANNLSELALNANKIEPPYATPVKGIRGRAFVVLTSFIQMDIIMKRTYMSDDIKSKVKLLYKKVLNKEDTRAVMFLFGCYFNIIYSWDREFSLSNINLIFSVEDKNKHLYTAAWEGLLSGPFGEKMFFTNKIQGVYFRGMQLNGKDYPLQNHLRDPDELIAKRIAWAFVAYYEKFGFEHRLFQTFLKSDNIQRYSYFITHIGRAFISNNGASPEDKRKRDFIQNNPEVKKNFCKFWDWMLKNCKHKETFVEFDSWLSTGGNIFEDRWLASTLVKTVQKTNGNSSWYNLHLVVANLAKKFPILALQIIQLYFLGDGKNNDSGGLSYIDSSEWMPTIKEIYNNPALKTEVKIKADNLISELIEKRGNEFRLLKKFIK